MSKKAVLIFDMPESCIDCPCCYDHMCCTAVSKSLIDDIINIFTGPLPSWCPLIETTINDISRVEIMMNRIKIEKENRL